LKAQGLSVWPLPAGPVGGKDSKGDGSNNDGNARSRWESDCVQIGMVLPPPPSGGAGATRVAGE
jgi:hypothetical protein